MIINILSKKQAKELIKEELKTTFKEIFKRLDNLNERYLILEERLKTKFSLREDKN